MSESVYYKALDVLKEASAAEGFLASANGRDNYARIWTRDGVVCGLAALASDEKDLILTFKSTLETIFKYQHKSGYFPSNVIPQTGKVSYGGAVGRADNPSWAIIGLCSYLKKVHSDEMKNRLMKQVEKGFEVMDAWEFNGKNLIYVPLSGDWADEYCQHGYILFDQLLRIYALELASQIYGNENWKSKALQIRRVIENNYWGKNVGEEIYWPLLNREKSNYPESFWLMGFNPAEIYPQFDLLANTLAIFLNLGSIDTQNILLSHLDKWFNTKSQLFPSFYPSILDNDAKMKILEKNYAYKFRNQPNEFHNGGVWPVWNGFLIAVLKNKAPEFAEKLKISLEKACYLSINKDINWEFNECLNSKTGLPNGVPFCSWSAAGYILAEKGIYEN